MQNLWVPTLADALSFILIRFCCRYTKVGSEKIRLWFKNCFCLLVLQSHLDFGLYIIGDPSIHFCVGGWSV